MKKKMAIFLGVVTFLIGCMGGLAGALSVLAMSQGMHTRMSETEYHKTIESFSDGKKIETETPSFEDINKIMVSDSFNMYFWSLSAFSVFINLALMAAGVMLIREKLNGIYILVSASAAYAIFENGVANVGMDFCNAPDALAAAWGVGNMGLSVLMLSWFWVWGPLWGGGLKILSRAKNIK